MASEDLRRRIGGAWDGWQLHAAGWVLCAAVVLGTGMWLTHRGRPYGAMVVPVHNLVGLVAVVLGGFGLWQARSA